MQTVPKTIYCLKSLKEIKETLHYNGPETDPLCILDNFYWNLPMNFIVGQIQSTITLNSNRQYVVEVVTGVIPDKKIIYRLDCDELYKGLETAVKFLDTFYDKKEDITEL